MATDKFNPADVFSNKTGAVVASASEVRKDNLIKLAEGGKISIDQWKELLLSAQDDKLTDKQVDRLKGLLGLEPSESKQDLLNHLAEARIPVLAKKKASNIAVDSDILPEDLEKVESTVNTIRTPIRKMRVTFELTGGYYTIPALDVKECEYGIMVIMPAEDNDATFAPSPGTEVVVHWGNNKVKCFSPGTMFSFDDFNGVSCLMIVLIRGE